jgi:hypothetical protein
MVRAKPPKVNHAGEILAENMSIQRHLVLEVITPVLTVINLHLRFAYKAVVDSLQKAASKAR